MLNKKTKCPTISKEPRRSFQAYSRHIYFQVEPLVETVRDPNDPTRFVFLRWQNGIATMVPSIEHAGTLYVPPDPMQALHSQIILPDGVRPCREPAALIADIVGTLAKFIDADRELWCSWRVSSCVAGSRTVSRLRPMSGLLALWAAQKRNS